MTHSKEEILKALTVIADTCEESDCENCPFSNEDADCLIMNRDLAPHNWRINKDEPFWRALL